MPTAAQPRSAISITLASMLALTVAMGIGRFAFTPMLPLMQADAGLSLAQGAWLASANYAGYLLGALTATRARLDPSIAVRLALALIVAATWAMGLTARLENWLALRFVAGVASAWALISVSSWSLSWLARLQRARLGSVVFSGVGLGVSLAGAVCLVLARQSVASQGIWRALGLAALLCTAAAWPVFARGRDRESAARLREEHSGDRDPAGNARHWRLVLCYGLFGFGYILPATFIPVLARQVIQDPAIFGLAWPLFGLAAAASTAALGIGTAYVPRRRRWALCHVIMAAGVVLPTLWRHPLSIAVAALCVGGTFMVITTLAIQEAEAVAAPHARALIATMTSAFATGQIIGPLLASALGGSLTLALWLAGVCLFASAALLLPSRRRAERRPAA